MNPPRKMAEVTDLITATTVGELLTLQAARQGDRSALLYGGECRDSAQPLADSCLAAAYSRRYTYRQCDDFARRVAKSLLAAGIEAGENVALWAPNLPVWQFIQFGCAKAGVPLVAVNTACRAYELEYILKQSDATVLFLTDGASQPGEYLTVLRELCPELAQSPAGLLTLARLPRLHRVVYLGQGEQPGLMTWAEFLADGAKVADSALAVRESQVGPHSLLSLQYTSGSTGFPKGVMQTHDAYLGTGAAIAACQGMTEQDVNCLPLPFFHAFADCVLMAGLTAGAATAAVEKFQAPAVLQTIADTAATMIYGTPTMFVAMLAEQDVRPYKLASLRGGGMAGAPCPPELVRAVHEKMGATELGAFYGSTEALTCLMSSPTAPAERRWRTVGQVTPDMEARICDDAGASVPTGEQGELCLRGRFVTPGYYRLATATAQAIDAQGWLHSGDLARMDADGYCRITGRIKDMIIKGGENIYPAEVEEFLFTHPQISNVQVVGIPCRYYGEEVAAFVIAKDGANLTGLELKKFCRRVIALHKVPAHFIFVDHFPQTVSGKVQKFKLRELAIQLLGDNKD